MLDEERMILSYYINHKISFWLPVIILILVFLVFDGSLQEIYEKKTTVADEFDIYLILLLTFSFCTYSLYRHIRCNPVDIHKHYFWTGFILMYIGIIAFIDLILYPDELNNFVKSLEKSVYPLVSLITFYLIPFTAGMSLIILNIKHVQNINRNKIITYFIFSIYMFIALISIDLELDNYVYQILILLLIPIFLFKLILKKIKMNKGKTN